MTLDAGPKRPSRNSCNRFAEWMRWCPGPTDAGEPTTSTSVAPGRKLTVPFVPAGNFDFRVHHLPPLLLATHQRAEARRLLTNPNPAATLPPIWGDSQRVSAAVKAK